MSKAEHEHILAFIQKKINEEDLRQSLRKKKCSIISKFKNHKGLNKA